MTASPTDVVRSVLQEYADRGVFRAFHERPAGRAASADFRILYLPITTSPFRLLYRDEPSTLTFKPLLVDLPARSDMYGHLKDFLRARSAADLPDHRRIDPARAELKWSNRRGNVDVTLHVTPGEEAYAARKAINLLTDVFHDLLTESPFYGYMEDHFDIPED